MKNRLWKGRVLFVCMAMFFLIGCSTKASNEKKETSEVFDAFDTMENDEEQQKSESSSIEIHSQVVGEYKDCNFIYEGKPIEFDYSWTADGECEMGLQIFIDGVLQEYEVAGKKTTMEKRMLSEGEEIFHISLEPMLGEKGDKLSLLFLNVYQPEVIEKNEQGYVMVENKQKMSSLMYWWITMNQTSKVREEQPKKGSFYTREITKEEQENFLKKDSFGNVKNELEYLQIFAMTDHEKIENFMIDGTNETIEFEMIGGKSQRYIVSFYVDFLPISVNGSVYHEVNMQKGKAALVEINKSELRGGKNLYALAIPLDGDEFWVKSSSYYLENME